MSIPDNGLADEEAVLDFVLLFPVVCCRGLQDVLLGVANAAVSILFQVEAPLSIMLVSTPNVNPMTFCTFLKKYEGKIFSFASSCIEFSRIFQE